LRAAVGGSGEKDPKIVGQGRRSAGTALFRQFYNPRKRNRGENGLYGERTTFGYLGPTSSEGSEELGRAFYVRDSKNNARLHGLSIRRTCPRKSREEEGGD